MFSSGEEKSENAKSTVTAKLPKSKENLKNMSASNITSNEDSGDNVDPAQNVLSMEQFRTLCFNYDLLQKVPDKLYEAIIAKLGE